MGANFVLYRYFNSQGDLLYVGITGDQLRRQKQHNKNSKWFSLVFSAHFEHFDSLEKVLLAEQKVIKTEKPLHNVIYNNENTIKIVKSKRNRKSWKWQGYSIRELPSGKFQLRIGNTQKSLGTFDSRKSAQIIASAYVKADKNKKSEIIKAILESKLKEGQTEI